MKHRVLLFVIALMIGLGNTASSFAQSEGGRLSFGFNAGMNKYWGEFTDNQFFVAGDLFLRYNVTSIFSIMGSYNIGQVRFKTNAEQIAKYDTYFGANAKQGDLYPNASVRIEDKNSIRWMSGEITGSVNLFASQSFVPYLFAGVGFMNWEPRSGDTGYEGALPNNTAEKYDKSKLVYPVGLGFELYLTDNLTFNGKGTYRIGMSDYFDDLSDKEDAKADSKVDQLLTFGLGFSYYILGDADYDKDGLTNSREKEIGTDPNNPDTDGEGLKDGEEVFTYYTDPLKADTDGDNLIDYDEVFTHKTSPIKADTDADGLNDGEEIARKTDPLNSDTDSDRLIDGDEVIKFTTDPLDKDTDSDGLFDGEEILKFSTNPKAKDSDTDGLSDGDEVKVYMTNPSLADSDSDELIDGLEINTYKTDPLKPDSDGDMLNDGEELNTYKSDPLKTDTDGDGLNDGDEAKKYMTNPIAVDTDSDGLRDGDEVSKYKTDPKIADTDKDGLKDGDEVLKYKSNPLALDSDSDLLSDGDEVNKYKTNPIVADTDKDKLTDGVEVTKTNTDPNNPDTDGDKIIDGDDDCPNVAGVASETKGRNGCPEPPKVGTKTDFPDILFVVNTDNFNLEEPATIRNLGKLLEYVNQCAGLKIKVEGHASEEGSKQRNQELSDLRAKKVRSWLIEQGVPADRIQGAIGFGSSKPKIKEPSGKALKKMSKDALEAIRKQNRRITVEVVKTCD